MENSAENIGQSFSTATPTTTTDFKNLTSAATNSNDENKPEVIIIGCGVAFGSLALVTVVIIFVWLRKCKKPRPKPRRPHSVGSLNIADFVRLGHTTHTGLNRLMKEADLWQADSTFDILGSLPQNVSTGHKTDLTYSSDQTQDAYDVLAPNNHVYVEVDNMDFDYVNVHSKQQEDCENCSVQTSGENQCETSSNQYFILEEQQENDVHCDVEHSEAFEPDSELTVVYSRGANNPLLEDSLVINCKDEDENYYESYSFSTGKNCTSTDARIETKDKTHHQETRNKQGVTMSLLFNFPFLTKLSSKPKKAQGKAKK